MSTSYETVLMDREGRSDLAAVPLSPRSTALVIVDMQYFSASRRTGLGKRFAESGNEEFARWRFDRIENLVIPNLQMLLRHFRRHRLYRFYVTVGSETGDFTDVPPHSRRMLREFNGQVGSTEASILSEIAPEPGEPILNKTTVNAFASTNLDSQLRRRNVEAVLFAGVSTSACVDSTARVAADLGYRSLLVEDACSDLQKINHERTLVLFQRIFGRVVTTQQALDELNAGVDAEGSVD